MGFSYNVNVLNQKGSPAIYTDTFVNRPAAGFVGRLFIANDTSAIYEDIGTAWVLIANVSSGAGTLQQVTTNGNTTDKGISISALGLSTNTLTVTSLTPGSVAFVGAADLITEDNANLFFDNTNNRLGIGTNTPSNVLDLHSALTTAMLALNNTAGNQSLIAFVNNSVAKWRIGNTAANNFEILNVGLSAIALTINVSDNSTDLGNNSIFSAYSYLTGLTSGTSGQTNLKIGTTTAGVPGGYYSIVPLSSGVLNFSSNLSAGNYRIFNIDSNSLTDSTTRTFTLPDASGTVALTTDLGAYLPLTGGTLTGSLQINSNITIGNQFIAGTYYLNISPSTTVPINLQGALAGVGPSAISLQASGQNVLIGSSVDDTVNKLQVTGNIKATGLAGTGSRAVIADANGTLSAPVSDQLVKENVQPLQYGLDTIMQLKPVQFEFIDNYKNYGEGLQIGNIAQDVEKLIPEAVFLTPSTGLKGIDYNQFHGIYIKAIQDQQKIIKSLIERIEQLENK